MTLLLNRVRARAVVRRGPFLSSSGPLLLLRPPTTSHPILKSHPASPDPPQAGHTPVPPHFSQSPSYPDSTAPPTSTPVPPHALHLPPPPHSVQGFDRAVITHPLGIEAEPLTGQPILHFPHASRLYKAISPDLESRAPIRRHAPNDPSSLDCRPRPSRRASEAALNLTSSSGLLRSEATTRVSTYPRGSGSPCISSQHTG